MKFINNILLVLLLGLFGQAHAVTMDIANDATFDFGGLQQTTDYGVVNGLIQTNDPNYDLVVDSVKIIGPDDPSRVGLLDITDMFTIASGPGLVSWSCII